MWISFSVSPSSRRSTRNAGPARYDRGDVVLVDFLLDHRLEPVLRLALRELLLKGGQLAVADLGDALELAVALGALGLPAQLVDAPGDLLDPLEDLLLVRPACGQSVAALLGLGELALERLAHVLRLLRHRGELDLELAHARSASSSSSGEGFISIRRRDAASSTRSIALSGRKRSAM